MGDFINLYLQCIRLLMYFISQNFSDSDYMNYRFSFILSLIFVYIFLNRNFSSFKNWCFVYCIDKNLSFNDPIKRKKLGYRLTKLLLLWTTLLLLLKTYIFSGKNTIKMFNFIKVLFKKKSITDFSILKTLTSSDLKLK